MDRHFDPEMIAEVARKVGGLRDSFSQAGSDLGDGHPGGAFGNLKNAESASQTMQSFHSGVNKHFQAASDLTHAASEALHGIARGDQENEDTWVKKFGGAAEPN